MKKNLLVIMFSCFVFVLNAQELVQTTIPGMKILISIPSEFTLMSNEMRDMKYPSKNGPSIVYTNATGSITVGVNLTKNNASDDIMEDYVSVFQKSFNNAYPSAEWISNGVMDINNKKVGYMELVTPAIDTEIYNLMFFTEYKSKLLLCTFNCTTEDKDKWSSTAHKIMNSIDVLQ